MESFFSCDGGNGNKGQDQERIANWRRAIESRGSDLLCSSLCWPQAGPAHLAADKKQ